MRFKWMPADRRTGERHNAAIFPPTVLRRLSALAGLPASLSRGIIGAFINATSEQARGGKSRRRPQGYSHYRVLLPLSSTPVFPPPSNVTRLLPLNCSVNFLKPVTSQSSPLRPTQRSKVKTTQPNKRL